MRIQTLITIDPGVTTGVAIFCRREQWEVKETFTFTGDKLPTKVFDHAATLFIVEQIIPHSKEFNMQALANYQRFVQILDVLQATYIFQLPTLMTGAKRYAKKYLKTFRTEHERDAICHGLAFLTSKQVDVRYIYDMD